MSFVQPISIPPRNLRSLETKHLKHDLTGRKFGRLFVVSFSHSERYQYWWVCSCSCGNIKLVSTHGLMSLGTKSCGCLSELNGKYPANKKHGMGKTRLYRIWTAMKSRCYNPNTDFYHVYGGRGIDICPQWRDDFRVFALWALANGYSDELEIDRIKNMNGYSPSNCRWVTHKVNCHNSRATKLQRFRGRMMSITDVAREIGIARETLAERLRRGLSLEKAIEITLSRRRPKPHQHPLTRKKVTTNA